MNSMKTSLFIANVVSVIFLINLIFINPSITGLAVAETPTNFKLDISSPLGISILFIITIIILDIYFYIKSKKEI